MSEPTLIVPRRNFLIRALGLTAGGAAMAVPIVTLPTAHARLRHHVEGAAAVMREIWPAREMLVHENVLSASPVDRPFLAIGHPFAG